MEGQGNRDRNRIWVTGDGRQDMGDRRWETEDGRQKKEENRQETGEGSLTSYPKNVALIICR